MRRNTRQLITKSQPHSSALIIMDCLGHQRRRRHQHRHCCQRRSHARARRAVLGRGLRHAVDADGADIAAPGVATSGGDLDQRRRGVGDGVVSNARHRGRAVELVGAAGGVRLDARRDAGLGRGRLLLLALELLALVAVDVEVALLVLLARRAVVRVAGDLARGGLPSAGAAVGRGGDRRVGLPLAEGRRHVARRPGARGGAVEARHGRHQVLQLGDAAAGAPHGGVQVGDLEREVVEAVPVLVLAQVVHLGQLAAAGLARDGRAVAQEAARRDGQRLVVAPVGPGARGLLEARPLVVVGRRAAEPALHDALGAGDSLDQAGVHKGLWHAAAGGLWTVAWGVVEWLFKRNATAAACSLQPEPAVALAIELARVAETLSAAARTSPSCHWQICSPESHCHLRVILAHFACIALSFSTMAFQRGSVPGLAVVAGVFGGAGAAALGVASDACEWSECCDQCHSGSSCTASIIAFRIRYHGSSCAYQWGTARPLVQQ